jgi:hypothetical protein
MGEDADLLKMAVGFLGHDVYYYLNGVEVFSFVLRNDGDLNKILKFIQLRPVKDDMIIVVSISRMKNLQFTAEKVAYKRESDGSLKRIEFDDIIPEELRGSVREKLNRNQGGTNG